MSGLSEVSKKRELWPHQEDKEVTTGSSPNNHENQSEIKDSEDITEMTKDEQTRWRAEQAAIPRARQIL